MSFKTWIALLGASVALCAAACGSDERFDASQVAGSGGSDAGTGGDAGSAGLGGGGGSASVRRSVSQRNPYGNVAESDNLLWDGDFEWHSAFSSQYGWVTPSLLGRYQPTTLDRISVGPQCRSGLKCAPLSRLSTILGVAVSPTNAAVLASVWAKPVSGDCADVEVGLIGCFDSREPEVALTPAAAPDAGGWCEYRGHFDPRERATCMAVSTLHKDSSITLVDDAVIKAAPENASIVRSNRKLSAHMRLEVPRWQAGMREWVRPGQKPATRAGDALRAWLSRHQRGTQL